MNLDLPKETADLILEQCFTFRFERVYTAASSAAQKRIYLGADWGRHFAFEGIQNDLNHLLGIVLAHPCFLRDEGY